MLLLTNQLLFCYRIIKNMFETREQYFIEHTPNMEMATLNFDN